MSNYNCVSEKEYSLYIEDGFFLKNNTLYKINYPAQILFLISIDYKSYFGKEVFFECIPFPMLLFSNNNTPLGGCFNARLIAHKHGIEISSTQDVLAYFHENLYPQFISINNINNCLLYRRDLFITAYGRFPTPSKEEVFSWIKAGEIQEAIETCKRFLAFYDSIPLQAEQHKNHTSIQIIKDEIICILNTIGSNPNYYNQQIEQLIDNNTKMISDFLNCNDVL